MEHDGFALLLDIGNGALGPLQRHIDPRDLNAIYLSHLHGDHWLDLVPLYYLLRHHPAGPTGPLTVYAPSGAADRVAAVIGKPVDELTEAFVFVDVPLEHIGPFDVRLARTVHSAECHAIRLTAGGSTLVYSGDAAPTPALVELARGADLLLCEASYLEGDSNPPGVHMTAREAAQHAVDAKVGRLLLTHLVPWNDPSKTLAEAQQAAGGLSTELAKPGAVLDI